MQRGRAAGPLAKRRGTTPAHLAAGCWLLAGVPLIRAEELTGMPSTRQFILRPGNEPYPGGRGAVF
jgi:hypothetical protein